MKPFVLVEIEDGSLLDTTVVGPSDIQVSVVDWDEMELDPDSAAEMIDELSRRYPYCYVTDPKVESVIDRLQVIVDANDEYSDEEDEDFDDEDGDDHIGLDYEDDEDARPTFDDLEDAREDPPTLTETFKTIEQHDAEMAAGFQVPDSDTSTDD